MSTHRRMARSIVGVVMVALMAGHALAAPIEPLDGTNLLSGKKAAYSLKPNYGYCTDPGDPMDLTNGKFWQSGGKTGFWTDKGTVGWGVGNKPGALITFDLGEVGPIGAIGFDTVTGQAQVTFPAAVFVYVSDDGATWHYVTDLINEAIKQDSFLRHRFVAKGLKTRGRHIAFFVAKGGFYAFVDEIEVIKGDHSPASVSFKDGAITKANLQSDAVVRAKTNMQKNATLYFIKAARDQVKATKGGDKSAVLKALDALRQQAASNPGGENVDYSKGLPYSNVDRQVCAVMGKYFGSCGDGAVTLWRSTGSMWSHTTNPFARPAKAVGPKLHADMMIGELEPVAFNLSNNTSGSVTLKVQVSDLKAPGGRAAWPNAKIERRITTHVLGSGFLFYDDALPLIKDDTLVIPAGMTRQVWLVLNSRGVARQEYAGTVTVTGAGARFTIPLTAKVYPVQMPANPTYLAQAWAYFTWLPAKGYEKQAAAEMERAYDNAHVLHHQYIPWPKFDKATRKLLRDADGRIVVDFTKLDEMLAYRPYVKQWLLWTGFEFGYMHLKYTSGATDMPAVGTPGHEVIFKEWVRQIRDHMAAKGFGTDRWAFYWADEPGKERFLKFIVPASKMAKEVDPSILVWEDHQIPLDLLEQYPDAIDIHCCPLEYYREHPDILKHALAEKHPPVHYLCGSSKANDPHTYYRLHHMAAVELGLDGAGMWVWGDGGGQFNDYAGSHPSYGMVYATTDGPIPGKRREAWREGIEDAELWRHLRAAAKKTGDARLVRLARETPARLLGKVAVGGAGGGTTTYGGGVHSGSPEQLMKTRLVVLKAVAGAMRGK